MTVVALQFLELNFSDRKDEWEMIQMKAEQWLQQQAGKMEGKTVEELSNLARALF